ncbi:class I SAM-dependent methyltransferase [Flavobacterium agricola]|uniref:Class I SAM-dependent methyltransferase n=1 Tax=Flavobacterium agricola TaxID=2870839 RepID=A0ABY6LXQ3_9FLAO|nr:class I SAM-dependent methyltransferase [Flavobacterium agricola]UYW01019.1 class I SAM-dependent methyltransferase [Flavobacterium agricola]
MNFDSQNVFLEVEDYSVSHQKFKLLYNEEYDILKTDPQPNATDLPKYYESEDYISHTDGKRSLFEKLYQVVKTKNNSDKVKLITKTNAGAGRVLDIGCGTGDFLIAASSAGWKITGYEPNEKAKTLACNKNVELVDATEELADASFDVITMWHVLEHVADLNAQIAELYRLLKPGGKLVIAVPNFKSFDAKYYKQYWAAYDVPRHLWHFSKKSIRKIFEEQALFLTAVEPLTFDSYYVALLSEKYKTGSMNPLKAFWIGFRSNFSAMNTREYSSHIYLLKKDL